jgi:hypothetical protein
MYPHWKEKVQQWQTRKQQVQEEQKHLANGQPAPSFTERFLVQKSPQVQFEATPGQLPYSVHPISPFSTLCYLLSKF